MMRRLLPTRRVSGTIKVPGDKSIAHRAAILSLLSESPITVRNFPDGADCRRSLDAVEKCGVQVKQRHDELVLNPPEELSVEPDTIIDCGNSGTTARLMAGLIAGSELSVILSGDESLSARPMKRIVDPLTEMGGRLYDTDGHLPLKVNGTRLLPFEYVMPVASAQVKSALILAGLASGCSVKVREKTLTRDHTEIMLQELGQGISVKKVTPVLVDDVHDPRKKRLKMPEDFRSEIRVGAGSRVKGGLVDIPGDISTAAFFFAAAALLGGSVTVENVGLNRTRTAFLEYLKNVGCDVAVTNRQTITGEPRGTVTVTGGDLKARRISGATTVELIDEIPVVAVLASKTRGTTLIRNAAELKVKESDRLRAISENLTAMSVKCGLLEDGLAIEGREELQGADLSSFGDHRIAMAFSVAALAASGPSSLDDDSSVAVSCPGFYDLLSAVVG
ncbi:MAG: 3-phosphoshikimate 1-carboxyvinyltransferase [Candidatus Zixiibacteriota bacterium]|nr:MAG: 3-phosphoshikimate 1-carboxyvinyltransferase [candidate division Zixibacteria bacterium]